MPEEPFRPEEAFEFFGVGIPTTKEESERAEREMAQCFIEEYVRMGYSPEFILGLCRNPFYRGLHGILQTRGEAFLRGLIEDTVRQWRPRSEPGTPPTAGSQAPIKESCDAEGV